MSESNTNIPVHNSEYIRSQRLVALNLIANQSSYSTDMDLDMSALLPNSAQALSDDQLQFVRAQRARNLTPPASDNASPTMELSDMDFTPTESITGAELQHRREQAAIQSSSEQDEDMDIETGIFNHNTYRKHLELDRLRRQREQHFLQLKMSIEESLPPTRKYYVSASLPIPVYLLTIRQSRNSLTDEQDPEFAMLIELDAPNDEWDYHSARMKVRSPNTPRITQALVELTGPAIPLPALPRVEGCHSGLQQIDHARIGASQTHGPVYSIGFCHAELSNRRVFADSFEQGSVA